MSRPVLPFAAVNRAGTPGYDHQLQRHHLLPRQLLRHGSLSRMFSQLDRAVIGFDDFRRNGLLLPATEAASTRHGLPLHRGPHRRYNELVIERTGGIEARWSRLRQRDPDRAQEEAAMRLRLLQGGLRRLLISGAGSARRLNRNDPLGTARDFALLDSIVDDLWGGLEGM